MPEPWINPDPITFKSLVGKCQRVDLTAIEHVINEGVVNDAADCELKCKLNPKECTGYQFTEATTVCKTFTGKYEIEGNGVEGSACAIKEKDIVPTFTEFTGQCKRVDTKDIAEELTVKTEDIEDVDSCKKICSETCTPKGCECKAFQYKADDKICIIFKETERIIGDTLPAYKCFIEEKPFDEKQFTLASGRCRRDDDIGSTNNLIQGAV